MLFQFKCLEVSYNKEDPLELLRTYNNKALPGGILEKLIDVFFDINNDLKPGDIAFVPILPPFYKKHNTLIDPTNISRDVLESEVHHTETTNSPTTTQEPPQSTEIEHIRPIVEKSNIKFRTYPYTFSRPNETIEAVIRLYNDMKVSKAILGKLLYIFSEINKDSLPPKLGQTVEIPVLLPFCYRHENDHHIFNDDK